jgi:hypothetical protein
MLLSNFKRSDTYKIIKIEKMFISIFLISFTFILVTFNLLTDVKITKYESDDETDESYNGEGSVGDEDEDEVTDSDLSDGAVFAPKYLEDKIVNYVSLERD